MRSKSPEDSVSLLSESAGSIDSMLNHSREDDEIKALMDGDDFLFDNHTCDIFGKFSTLVYREEIFSLNCFSL